MVTWVAHLNRVTQCQPVFSVTILKREKKRRGMVYEVGWVIH